jgi:FAD/FMN-containing dehydrogenase
MVALAAIVGTLEERPAHLAWVERFAAEIEQTDSGAYVNFIGDEGPDRVRAAYPGATWDRLATIKRQYDPTNLFRRNQNVPPASA